KVVSSFTAPIRRPIEPVGRYFLAHASRTLRGHTWSEYERIEASKNVKTVNENDDDKLDEFDEHQSDELLTHDPREWKKADLYAVLGLSKLRYNATEEQIRKAHRRQVLKHHPDKKGEKGGLDEDGFFKIIQKAYETLLDPIQKKRFDSVDENADIYPPSKQLKYDFFTTWGPIFDSEGRFSKKKNVPKIGDIHTSKAEVESFYNFFYKFDSWRTFEWLDEDVPDDSSNRDHKRYIERKNKTQRDKKKKEDNKRLLSLVDRAFSEDPRIKLFKKKEKEEKVKRKWEREAGSRKALEEARLKKEAEEKAKKEAEEKAKSLKQNSKKAKEALKSAKKKNKRIIRNSVKGVDYFGDLSSQTKIDSDVELLIGALDDSQLSSYSKEINQVKDSQKIKKILEDAISSLTSDGKISSSSLSYF
ncbi:zuotin, partial [Ascoidea rubescens DSM 1968]